MIATIQTMIKRLTPIFIRIRNNKTNNLGRWNSVVKPVSIERNKYIDWGNMDHSCYYFVEKKIK